MIRGIRALIFDMDGVIIDSEPLHLLAYQELLSRYKIKYTEGENQEFLGRKDLEMSKIVVARYKLPVEAETLVEAKEQILARLISEQAIARPGLMKVLTAADALKMHVALASSATLPTIELVTETLGVRKYFSNLTSGDEVPNGKPAPDVFLLAARRLGVAPQHCLVIEDTANGIRAAKAAGMHCVSIPCEATVHEDHSHADMHLKSLEELDLDALTAKPVST